MNLLFRFKKYCSYCLHARKGKYAHSPFVYQLSTAVFEKKLPLSTTSSHHFDNDKYGKLTAKIADYLNVKTIASFPDNPAQKADMTLINMTPKTENAYDYFKETIKYSDNNSVVIVKNIYCSPESAIVWEKIKTHPKTTVTFDMFQIGVVFFRRESSKENFIIKY